MLSVTNIIQFLYCPKKLYASKKLGYVEPITDRMIFGTIAHEIVEKLFLFEKDIIVMSKDTEEELVRKYMLKFSRTLSQIVIKYRKDLDRLNTPMMSYFKDAKLILQEHARERVRSLLLVMKEHKVYGRELWEKVSPKIIVEKDIISKSMGLRGRIDQLFDLNGVLTPVELKTSEPPKNGTVREDHALQLAAYALMLEEQGHPIIEKGIVHYIRHYETRDVYLNPFMKQKVKDLILSANTMLSSSIMPEKGCRTCAVCTSPVGRQ